MKLPSFTYLLHNTGRAFLRFPITLLSALVAVVIGIYLFELDADVLDLRYVNVMLCAALGISLFFCVTVFSDKQGYGLKLRVVLHVAAALVLVALYFTLPSAVEPINNSLPYIRYGIYNVVMHLLVAVVPFLEKGKLNGFWHYNKILFIRFLTALLYSGFLYAGLALALGSLDFLFDIDLHEKLFFDLFVVIGGLFNTWFFIAGIPSDFNALDGVEEYPKGIKIFSQYVLLPLLILYLIILYVYAAKIVVLWSWPKGLVSYLISCVAVLGILTLLLIHPYGNLPGNGWIKKFSRIYYFALFPLVVLLFIAIGMRVNDYGITINRYIIVLLGIWLTLVCFYFSLGNKNIKFIPISLAIILMLMTFGYWGMFSVSERSQVNRLRGILEQYKILQNGKIKGEVIWRKDSLHRLFAANNENVNEGLMPDSVHNEVRSILDYLDDYHGFTLLRPWYQQDIDSLARATRSAKSYRRSGETEVYMRSMGLKDEYLYGSAETTKYYSFSTPRQSDRAVDVRGFDYMHTIKNSGLHSDENFFIGETRCDVVFPKLPSDPLLLIANKDTLVLRTDSLMTVLISRYNHERTRDIPASQMSLHSSNHQWRVRLDINNLYLYPTRDVLQVEGIDADLLITKRAPHKP
ncbi:DUF4153 domain-containing protein [Chryseolinea lacunae]|uniref:DUF4153 domain-containing protein n=1 Tax=Chryseolinea lacunae TaxID=2801331 RepID=A0ABS1KKJ3_9BACT|nr:DUF4153 domain-containing protein [Chryseolinea lacunae]MBL0739980.1 DUF4153 domain-containing protein [Chryseolinea lacunae]